MTAAKLQRLFHHYNRRYWNGELRPYVIVTGVRLTGGLHAMIYKPWHQLWFDDRKIKTDREWRISLLHEMAHIRAKTGHGPTWIAELRRCPDYVIRKESGGDKEVFRYIKHGVGGPYYYP